MEQQKLLRVDLESLQSLIDRNEDRTKKAQYDVLIIKKRTKLKNALGNAEVAVLEVKQKLEKAMLDENADEIASIRDLERATTAYAYYQEIYEALFPNE